MKISLFPKQFREFISSTMNAELFIVTTIIIIMFGVLIIPISMAEHRLSHRETSDRNHISLHVGDVVYIKELNLKGVVNAVGCEAVDVLVIGKDGQPNLIKYINRKLISK